MSAINPLYGAGVEKVTIIDKKGNVYTIAQPENATFDGTMEQVELRGGSNHSLHDVLGHSPKEEFKMNTASIEPALLEILLGGTLTETAAATGGVDQALAIFYGSTNSLTTAITSITTPTPDKLRQTNYMIKAIDTDTVLVTRIADGYQQTVVLTASATISIDDECDVNVVTGATINLTAGEVARFSTKPTTYGNTYVWERDPSKKPQAVELYVYYKHESMDTRQIIERELYLPNAKASGDTIGGASNDFHRRDISFLIVGGIDNNSKDIKITTNEVGF